jgi:branched-chain amino acid aminotransferase
MCLPPIDADLQLEAIETLVDLERGLGAEVLRHVALYPPPMIGDGSRLGICKARGTSTTSSARLPAPFTRAAFSRSASTLRILTCARWRANGQRQNRRNYASSLLAATNAKQRGFDQVLWLDGRENKYIEEVGAMNVMFVLDGVLTTPAINGEFLTDITRRSVLALARSMDIPAVERTISVDELFEASRTGRLTEAFGTGTAAVISPIGELEYKGNSIVLGEQIGPVAKVMYDTLTGIQTGRIPDERGWTRIVPRIFSPLE